MCSPQSRQDLLQLIAQNTLQKKTIRGNFAARILKAEGAKQKNKTKARGELFASSFRKFDSRETQANLTHQLIANRVTNFAHAR